jgi:succinate-semialdehyde dehydrogenase/glutarate-semialdehyde dehydrogenase
MYSDVSLYIDGRWRDGRRGTLPIINPASEEEIGRLAHASTEDLDEALEAAARSFKTWSKVPALERSKLLRKVASLIRERADEIAPILTTEQGKPLAEAKQECGAAADIFDWFAEEARRTYGQVIPARVSGVQQILVKEPVGPVAAFTPWNYPLSQPARKIAAALAAGCTIIIKGPEETPASVAHLARAIADAGVPAGVVNLVFGIPAEISGYLIPHPLIRKVSFTGSTAVGKQLAALAGLHMKRVTMELGGHAPAIVFDDADLDATASLLVGAKFRNAGQVCISPTRFLVQESVYEGFLDRFIKGAEAVKVGDGREAGTKMGPLAHHRRVEWMETLVADAAQQGGQVRTGGSRVGNKGYFFQPTVLTDLPLTARAMNEEPFGPVALVSPFRTLDDAVSEANRLPYGLAAYAYTRSAQRAAAVSGSVETGMISINHQGLGLAEIHFGGVKDSGYGSEGGSEAIEGYLVSKLVSQLS